MTPLAKSQNLAARMGRWSASHRKTAIFGWLAFVVVAVALGSVVGTKSLDPADAEAGDSRRALQIVDNGGFDDTVDESVFIEHESLPASSPQFKAVVDDVVADLNAASGVSRVRSPLDDPKLVSPDGQAVLVQYELDDTGVGAVDRIEPILAAADDLEAANPGFTVDGFGSASGEKSVNDTIESDFQRAEFTAVPLTLGILLIVFGAAVAAGIPLLLGLSAVIATLGLLAVPSQLVPMDEASASIILLIGLAVGVDYSLFYLKREREERAAGRGPAAALEAAAATSGRAVLISGLTVIIALAGLFFGGTAIWTSIAVGTIMVVAIAVAGSLTVLPALLSWLGDRVEKGKIPFVHRLSRKGGDSRVWGAILDRVLRRPLVSAVASAGVLVVLALPAFGMHTAFPGISSLPREIPIMKTYDRIQASFPGGPLPAVVAVEADNVASPEFEAAFADFRRQALATGQMEDPIEVQVNDAATVAVISVPLAGTGTDDASTEALLTLREDVIPATLGSVDGAEVAVAGETASSYDFSQLTKDRAPYVFAFVLLLAFGLLLVAFRSLVIAAKAVVLNVLSVAAAYGLLVIVFQWGWGESLLGFESTGAITAWLPLFMFVILFGLSMDYHVFILSRIREAFDRGLDTEAAVTHGIKSTAGVVTAAAIVMVAVFSIFATLSTIDMKQAGVGLAAAILIDATIVRAVLLPSAMKLLGDWNWYLPRWLEWLPEVSHETERSPQGVPAPAASGR
ncbi:MAG TPA: MMPL family transporter [Candidatus Polarisedimenticolia bacterium]|nr:MMPL family transporter [Candidatus Polarisedimenticolia bacterium]